MTGLLLKDGYTLLKQARIFLAIIVFFAVTGNDLTSAMAAIYAAILPITALAYDERSKWDSLAAMMPYSAWQLVLSKYVLGYLGILGATVLSAGGQGLISLWKGAPVSGEELMATLLFACVAAVMMAVNLPFMFWLGVERGRIVFFLLIGGTMLVSMTAGDWLLAALSAAPLSPGLLAGLAAASAAAVNLVSIAASMALYRRKPV